MAKTRLNVSLDSKVKEEAKVIYESMGLNLNTAINMFLIRTIQDRKMPFTPKAENPESVQARYEALYMRDELPTFDSADEVWEALNED